MGWYNESMAIIMNNQNQRTELQKRIAAELDEKAKKKALGETERPDGIKDSAYIENTKATTSLAWLWAVIAVATMAILIWLVVVTA